MAQGEKTPFDVNSAISRLSELELLRDMMQFFLEDSPSLLQRIGEGVKQRDAPAVQHAAHSLKSLTATLSARAATDAARQVEELALDEQFNDLAKAVPELVEHVAELQGGVRDYLNDDHSGNAGDATD